MKKIINMMAVFILLLSTFSFLFVRNTNVVVNAAASELNECNNSTAAQTNGGCKKDDSGKGSVIITSEGLITVTYNCLF